MNLNELSQILEMYILKVTFFSDTFLPITPPSLFFQPMDYMNTRSEKARFQLFVIVVMHIICGNCVIICHICESPAELLMLPTLASLRATFQKANWLKEMLLQFPHFKTATAGIHRQSNGFLVPGIIYVRGIERISQKYRWLWKISKCWSQTFIYSKKQNC